MNEPDLNKQLTQQDLFTAFCTQLAKDFESCGLAADFTNSLPADFIKIREVIVTQTAPVFSRSPGALMQLLYRIDISEAQIRKYSGAHSDLQFSEVVAELIIKRELQKIILKRRFSPK